MINFKKWIIFRETAVFTYRKHVNTAVDLAKAQKELIDCLVPFQIVNTDEQSGEYEILQAKVIPLGAEKSPLNISDNAYQGILDLIKQFWSKGYAFTDFMPQNVAWHNNKLKVLDLDSFMKIEDDSFNSVEELLNIAAKTFKKL